MLFFVQLGLTVAAWRKGWKAWALMPVGATILISFLLGSVMWVAGGSAASITPLVLLLDVGSIAVLIGMVKRPPQLAQLPVPPQAEVVAEAPYGNVEDQTPVSIH